MNLNPRNQNTGTFHGDDYVPNSRNEQGNNLFVSVQPHNHSSDDNKFGDESETVNEITKDSIYREDPNDEEIEEN